MSSLEEKLQYTLDDRTRDLHELLESCLQRVSILIYRYSPFIELIILNLKLSLISKLSAYMFNRHRIEYLQWFSGIFLFDYCYQCKSLMLEASSLRHEIHYFSAFKHFTVSICYAEFYVKICWVPSTLEMCIAFLRWPKLNSSNISSSFKQRFSRILALASQRSLISFLHSCHFASFCFQHWPASSALSFLLG